MTSNKWSEEELDLVVSLLRSGGVQGFIGDAQHTCQACGETSGMTCLCGASLCYAHVPTHVCNNLRSMTDGDDRDV
jgi:hypothetical protein